MFVIMTGDIMGGGLVYRAFVEGGGDTIYSMAHLHHGNIGCRRNSGVYTEHILVIQPQLNRLLHTSG